MKRLSVSLIPRETQDKTTGRRSPRPRCGLLPGRDHKRPSLSTRTRRTRGPAPCGERWLAQPSGRTVRGASKRLTAELPRTVGCQTAHEDRPPLPQTRGAGNGGVTHSQHISLPVILTRAVTSVSLSCVSSARGRHTHASYVRTCLHLSRLCLWRPSCVRWGCGRALRWNQPAWLPPASLPAASRMRAGPHAELSPPFPLARARCSVYSRAFNQCRPVKLAAAFTLRVPGVTLATCREGYPLRARGPLPSCECKE